MATKQQSMLMGDGKATTTVEAPPAETEANSILLNQVFEKTCLKLDKLAADYTTEIDKCVGNFRRAMLTAKAIAVLRREINDQVMDGIMCLMNSPLGFKTDRPNQKNNTPYSMAEVKECFIESLLRGLQPTGNEWNIIAGNLYITKEGFTRKVRELPGLTDLELDFAPPKMAGAGATVIASATWKLNEAPMKLYSDLAIRVNAMMGADAIVGKATRKILSRVYQKVTGSAHSLPDGDVSDVSGDFFTARGATGEQQLEEAKNRTDQLAQRLQAANGKPDPVVLINNGQELELTDLLRDTNSNIQDFLDQFNVKALNDLPASKFDEAIQLLLPRKSTLPV